MLQQFKSRVSGKTFFANKYNILADYVDLNYGYGHCINCGEETEGLEPDVGGRKCEECSEHKVYSAVQLLMAGLYYK